MLRYITERVMLSFSIEEKPPTKMVTPLNVQKDVTFWTKVSNWKTHQRAGLSIRNWFRVIYIYTVDFTVKRTTIVPPPSDMPFHDIVLNDGNKVYKD